ncbi:MAG: hypothetical protein JXJ04_23740 [Spirochaetales bacterium]|nr:hypothetical protein [Spirochaetales bacterium]
MKKLLFIFLFCLIIISQGFSSGGKEKDEPENPEWKGIPSSTLFGYVEITASDKVIIRSRTDNESVYNIVGDKTRAFRKAAGNYVFLRGKIKKDESRGKPKVLAMELLVIQSSPDPDWSQAGTIEIEGIIEKGMNNRLCIITNWESRSRVSHYVYGELNKAMADAIGFIAIVKGLEVLTLADSSPFVKEIVVEEIISLRENNTE